MGVQHPLLRLPPEGLLDEIAHHAGQGSHAPGQLSRPAVDRDLLDEELLKQVGDSLNAIFGPLDLPVPGHGGESGGLPVFAFHVPAELQVVGEDQVVE